MSIARYNILFFFSIFPIWILKFNLGKIDIFCIILVTLFLILINLFIVNLYKKKFNSIFFQIYFSLIIAWGIDNNIGLHNGIILLKKDFWSDALGNIYVAALIFFILIALINFLLIKYLKSNGLIILSFFLISISIFNLIDNTKSYKNIKSFDRTTNSSQFIKAKVLIILDEMSGIDSLESKTLKGKEFDRAARNFSKKHNLILYSNIFTLSSNSNKSIGSLLNKNFTDDLKVNEYIRPSTNFFSEYELIKNKAFEEFSSISVYQNMHINYCNPIIENINKCEQYNPFNQTNFISGFKNTFLTRVISAWKYNGSTLAAITWRLLMEFRIIDTTFGPYGEKATFPNLLKKITNDIKSKKFDLIFAHTLVPHKPYGFTKKCDYDGKHSLGNFSTNMKIEQHTYRHNIDRICTLKFLDDFLSEIKKKKYLDNLEIIILSDHGSRIKMNDSESALKNVLFYKKPNLNFKEINEKHILQKTIAGLFIR